MMFRVLILLSLFSVCLSSARAQSSSTEILNGFMAAFNAHDTEGMLPFVSDSIRWFSIAGDSTSVDVSGKPALEKWLRGYFKGCPSCRSEFLSIQEAGRFVSVHEKASWREKNGERSQKSLGVYEILHQKIQRVWYFPAEQ